MREVTKEKKRFLSSQRERERRGSWGQPVVEGGSSLLPLILKQSSEWKPG